MRNHSYHMAIIMLGILTGMLFLPSLSVAQVTVTLAWDANPETDIDGYTVYYGTVSRSWNGGYEQSVDVDPAVNCDTQTCSQTLTGLDPSKTYYFAVKAYDISGNVSDYSAELRRQSYTDVPVNNLIYNFVMDISDGGITGGCQGDNPATPENEANFCPDNPITRGQMAVFIETSLGAAPVTCSGTRFTDVTPALVGQAFCDFIEDFATRGITAGCTPTTFCPNTPISRGQMAVFIEAALGNEPAFCSDQFSDVPWTHPFCGFIERLAADGITGGCGGSNFCPDAPVTRAQMAVFIVTAPDPLFP